MEHTGSDIGGPTLRKIYHPAGVIREQPGVYFDHCVSREDAHRWMDAYERSVSDFGFCLPSMISLFDAPPAWVRFPFGYIGATGRDQEKEGQLSRYVNRSSPMLRLPSHFAWVAPLPTRIEINLP